MKHKPANGWAVAHWAGHIYLDTIRERRKDAILAFRESYGDDAWGERSPRLIHRAIKLAVLPVISLKGI